MTAAVSTDSEVHTVQEQTANPLQDSSDDPLIMSTNEMSETDLDPVDSTYSHQQTENSTLLQNDASHTPENATSSTTQLNLPSHDSNIQLDLHPCCFTLVGDNIDKNF